MPSYDQILQFLAELEIRSLSCGDVHASACFGIATVPGRTLPYAEAAKPPDLDFAACAQRTRNAVEHVNLESFRDIPVARETCSIRSSLVISLA